MPVKHLKISDIKRIVNIYSSRKIDCFPRILNYSIIPKKSFIEFEWLEGIAITDLDLNDAFYTLGKMHKINSVKRNKDSVYTVCHGDVHTKNILRADGNIMFIDTLYVHIGWNYTDLDYVDHYDLFDKVKYPWIIKNKDILFPYLEGLEMNLKKPEIESFKKKAAVHALRSYIKNGSKNNINITYEKKCLKQLLS